MTESRNKSLLQDTAVSHALAKKKDFPACFTDQTMTTAFTIFYFYRLQQIWLQAIQLKTETTLGFKGTQRADLENACY